MKFPKQGFAFFALTWLMLIAALQAQAAVSLEQTYKVTDGALYLNGVQSKSENSPNKSNPNVLDFAFGDKISAHGDAIKVYKDFIFTTWYKGGKYNRNLMLSRYNTKTGVVKTIEFPHKHTGFRGITTLGESHNTAAVGISPKDGKIHILYDMHSYNDTQFPGDYFRYSYTKTNAATVPDSEFKLSLFVADKTNDYGHNNLNGQDDRSQYMDLTYPTFFLNENNDLLFFMRTGGNNNGGYVFTSYNATTGEWARMTQFNVLNAAGKSTTDSVNHNWGLYGEMKFVNGKLRTAFQTRSANNNDKYQYQNGIFYAYSDDQTGRSKWKTHSGKSFNIPLVDPAPLKIYEPGNLVNTTQKNAVYIVGGFDFTVTDKGDVHIVSMVKDKQYNVTKKLHSYKPAGATKFTNTTNFNGGSSLYTSGDQVYIIGLKSGRPFIQVAKGGTNNFTTVYEDKTGPQFNHGVLTIHQGKVYYLLQKAKYASIRAAGDSTAKNRKTTSMPLHVQVIDLGLNLSEPEPEPDPVVDYTPPAGFEFAADPGETITVTGTMDLAFGANGAFNYLRGQTENVLCSRDVFGDPLLGVVKKCYMKALNVPEELANDEYCTVVDLGFGSGQEKFRTSCDTKGFTFNRCYKMEGYRSNWVACSSMSNPLDYVHTIASTGGTRVEAEDYARAEDVSDENKGGAYRAGGVDIEKTTDVDGGYQVGWIADSDVVYYDVFVPESGYYKMSLRFANTQNNLTVSVRADGKDRVSAQPIAKTSSETSFANNSFNLGELSAGSHEIAIQFTANYKFQHKFNYFMLEQVAVPAQSEFLPEPELEGSFEPKVPFDDRDFETGTEDYVAGEIITGGEAGGETGTETGNDEAATAGEQNTLDKLEQSDSDSARLSAELAGSLNPGLVCFVLLFIVGVRRRT